ncbi:YbaK/EbsC family protein [Mycobacterium hubeiense]|uniref:YbaK/EbsC family protein n=1 Tax=Mycobacterium hubeiense TaxID=1867256 RepID=UPI000C7F0183|nr:YbaK/EbsC family protein [Mycobacterium sp. QGD 101]
MNERNSRVAAALQNLGIEPAIRILDEDAKTAVAAARQLGCEVGAIANSLVFACDGEPLLVMASGASRVDTDLLAASLRAGEISKATPQLVRTATGQAIGGVAPTGHPRRLRTLVDETLSRYPVIWTAAGTADSVMPLT